VSDMRCVGPICEVTMESLRASIASLRGTMAGDVAESKEPVVDSSATHSSGNSWLPGSPHDVPGVGYLTVAFSDSFNGLLGCNPSEEELEATFGKLDTDKNGLLDMNEAADAMRTLGYSERQVQGLMDSWPGDREKGKARLDLVSFKTLMVRPSRPYTIPCDVLGYEVPVPNPGKVLDTPVLGETMTMTGDIIARPYDDFCRGSFRCLNSPSDNMLLETFYELDKKKTGRINLADFATGMRHWGISETSIKTAVEAAKSDTIGIHEFKKAIRGPKFARGYIEHVPLVGSPISDNLTFEHEWTDEDVREVFCMYGDGKDLTSPLDKTQAAEALRELGLSEFNVQKKIDSVDEDSIDYAAFKALLEEPRITWTKDVFGFPAPNPGKLFDVPVVGTVASLTTDVAVESVDWTVGAIGRNFVRVSEEDLQAAFKEADPDKDGKIDKLAVGKVMRATGHKEWQIKSTLSELTTNKLTMSELMELIPTKRSAVADSAASAA